MKSLSDIHKSIIIYYKASGSLKGHSEIKIRVNYKFCPLCLHQIAGAVLFSKSLQAVSLTFQNLARYVLLTKPS
ncbi:hypothetical protein Hanom_Chr03g00242071 [Helianthus anomalus]